MEVSFQVAIDVSLVECSTAILLYGRDLITEPEQSAALHTLKNNDVKTNDIKANVRKIFLTKIF